MSLIIRHVMGVFFAKSEYENSSDMKKSDHFELTLIFNDIILCLRL